MHTRCRTGGDAVTEPVPAGANIAAHLARMALDRPYATAVVCPDGRDRWGRVRYVHLTYRQLDEASAQVARGLERVGIGPGVRTVLMVSPSLEMYTLVFALFRAGAVPVLVDPGIGLANLKRCLGNARPEAFVGVPKANLARLILGWSRRTIRTTVTVGRRRLLAGRTLADLEREGAVGHAPMAGPDGEMAAILFTSGSTGTPKGVIYGHGNFQAQVAAIGEMLGIEPGEVDCPTFPLFGLFDPALGMTTVVPDMDPTRPATVDPRRIVEAVHDFGVTNMFGSPALLNTVGRYGEATGAKLPSLRRVTSAGAPVSARIIERFLTMLPEGAEVFTPYGATESLPVALIGSNEVLAETRYATDEGRGVCVGRPVPSIEVSIIAITDDPIRSWSKAELLPTGQIGEIVVRGPQVTVGYFADERATELAKIPNGDGTVAHRMGDLGYLDDDGRLWFGGRKSQRVRAAGGELYTVPCEGVFDTHPDVYRSALVGVQRDDGIEPVIVVELEPEAYRRDTAALTTELLDIGARFEHTAGIRAVLVHPSFPVDTRHNAKIRRGQLAEWASRRLR